MGQTKNGLRVRLLKHIGDIRNRNTVSSVSIHFNGDCGGGNWTFKILDFETDTFKRLVKEQSWIEILKSAMGYKQT